MLSSSPSSSPACASASPFPGAASSCAAAPSSAAPSSAAACASASSSSAEQTLAVSFSLKDHFSLPWRASCTFELLFSVLAYFCTIPCDRHSNLSSRFLRNSSVQSLFAFKQMYTDIAGWPSFKNASRHSVGTLHSQQSGISLPLDQMVRSFSWTGSWQKMHHPTTLP